MRRDLACSFVAAAFLAITVPAGAQTPRPVPSVLPGPRLTQGPQPSSSAAPSQPRTPCEAIDRMRQAMAAAHSYSSVQQIVGTGLGWPLHRDFVAPNRTHDTMTGTLRGMTATNETIMIGSDAWSKRPGTGWMKVPPGPSVGRGPLTGPAVAGGIPGAAPGTGTACTGATDMGMEGDVHVYEVQANGTTIRYYLRPDFLPAKIVQSGPNVTTTETYSQWNGPIVIEPPI